MNLLEETKKILKNNGKLESDVLWVGGSNFKTTWQNFTDVANVEYDSGYGSQEVAQDLIVMGNTFWIERHEYDGSEWWEYKSKDIYIPTEIKEIKAITISQAEALGYDVSCGWESLAKINGVK